MDKITLEQAKKVALLSRIYFSDLDLERITKELDGVLHWIEKIQGINTDNINPLLNPNNDALTFLEDVADNNNLQQDILKNAPKTKYGYFVVPKIIE